MKGRRAQGWGFDLVIALMIFSAVLFLFFFYILNYSPEADKNLADMNSEADSISNLILSEGRPTDWNSSNIQEIGILTGKKINETKLYNFFNISTDNYDLTKSLLKTNYEYFINFSETIYSNGILISEIGKEPTESEYLSKSSRQAIYNNKPITIYFEVWK